MISLNTRRPHTHTYMLFPVCVARGNGLARSGGDVSSDVRALEREGMTSAEGGVPEDSYQLQPALAVRTFSHSVSVLTTKAALTPADPTF